jgi:hypothetical protein
MSSRAARTIQGRQGDTKAFGPRPAPMAVTEYGTAGLAAIVSAPAREQSYSRIFVSVVMWICDGIAHTCSCFPLTLGEAETV